MFFALLGNIACAQTMFVQPKAGIVFGRRAISDFLLQGPYNKIESNIKFRSGFSGGFAFETKLGSNRLSLQSEIWYIQKGYSVERTLSEFGYTITGKSFERINYFEVPVLLKINFGKKDKLNISFYAGPYVGYGINGKYSEQGGITDFGMNMGRLFTGKGKIEFDERLQPYYVDGTRYYDPKTQARRLDLGTYVGVQGSYPFWIGAITLESRYGHGFVDFNRQPENSVRTRADYKSQNRAIGIFLGYALPIN